MRLRKAVEAADVKDSDAAKVLAEAVLARRAAVRALAHAEGVGAVAIAPTPDQGGVAGGERKLFQVVWSQKFFGSQETLECEEHEKRAWERFVRGLMLPRRS